MTLPKHVDEVRVGFGPDGPWICPEDYHVPASSEVARFTRWGLPLVCAHFEGGSVALAPGWAIVVANSAWLTERERARIVKALHESAELRGAYCTALVLGGEVAARKWLERWFGLPSEFQVAVPRSRKAP